MKFIFIFLFFLISCSTTKNTVTKGTEKSTKKNLPVWISYGKFLPPDSIVDFIKVYIQAKGYETFNQQEAMTAVQSEIRDAFMNIINSNSASGGDFGKKMEKKYEPMCNLLWVHIFSNKLRIDNYYIDSIQWKTNILPAKDSGTLVQRFYPSEITKSNSYSSLKIFLDSVIASGYLNKIF